MTNPMNLIQALEIINKPIGKKASLHRVFLACGFTPLHLQTFLNAGLRKILPNHRIEIETGLFGDLLGNLERLDPETIDTAVVCLEWVDFDTRLGIRNFGGWRSTDLTDIIETVRERSDQMCRILEKSVQSIPTVCSMPTLPLPPMFSQKTRESGIWELQLRQIIASLGVSISKMKGIRVLSSQTLDEMSPTRDRFDARSEITAGFPYTLRHASILADLLAGIAHNPAPKKGLITDLDDTLWSGILGEVGIDNISWSLDQHSHEHGLYQQFLSSLASAGVLIGAASKNDKALVEKVFQRKDLLVGIEDIFPFEVHWSQKSISVKRILDIWNIAADSVVFVDDSPMELAEVKAAFPEIECIPFPKGNHDGVWQLLRQLRDLFGKSFVSEEDALRMNSIKSASTLRNDIKAEGGSPDKFLKNSNAFISFTLNKLPDDRAFELINKTNQFNLNGRRLTESEWASFLRGRHTQLLTVSYKDKYGPLGKIAALLIRLDDEKVYVESWVMSCRAFSRRIEYQCLKYLFEKFEVDEIVFDYHETDRNGPLQEFFSQIIGNQPAQHLKVSKTSFSNKSPLLFHQVEEAENG